MKKIIIIITIFVFTTGPVKTEPGAVEKSCEELVNVKLSEQTGTADSIVAELTGEVKFHVFEVSNPPRLVLEMVDTVHNWQPGEIEVGGRSVKRVRSGQYKNKPVKITRVVLDMEESEYTYNQDFTDNKIVISAALSPEELKKISREKEEPETPDKVEKEEKQKFSLDQNIPTREHIEKVSQIKKDAQTRHQERKKRLEEISELEETVREHSLKNTLGTDPVNFNFKETKISDILRSFEMQLDINIIPDKNIAGEVTFRLKDVPFYEAFNMLMDRVDLVALQVRPNVIRIMEKDNLPTERKTINLTNRNAEDIKTTLEALLSPEEQQVTTMGVDETSNSLIVSATPSVHNKIELLTDQLDIKSPQIKIKARLIEVNATDEFTTGMTWAASIPMDIPTEFNPATGEFEKVPADAKRRVRTARDLGSYEVDEDQYIDYSGVLEDYGGSGGVIDVSAILDNTQLYGLLNLLSSDSEAKTLSEPTILTENNKEASIHVGQNLPIRRREVTETGTTEEVDFIQEGVDLRVTPLVSPGSEQISMQVNIRVSELIGFRADNPITAQRAANTEITVESGKTVVIGGLIRESKTQTESGIPLLKDIPFLGYLFKNTSTNEDRRELLIFLSPELLKG